MEKKEAIEYLVSEYCDMCEKKYSECYEYVTVSTFGFSNSIMIRDGKYVCKKYKKFKAKKVNIQEEIEL
jgi:hypothetical protein